MRSRPLQVALTSPLLPLMGSHKARQVREDAARRRLHAQKGIADSGAARQRPTASSAFISRGEVVGGVGELGGGNE